MKTSICGGRRVGWRGSQVCSRAALSHWLGDGRCFSARPHLWWSPATRFQARCREGPAPLARAGLRQGVGGRGGKGTARVSTLGAWALAVASRVAGVHQRGHAPACWQGRRRSSSPASPGCEASVVSTSQARRAGSARRGAKQVKTTPSIAATLACGSFHVCRAAGGRGRVSGRGSEASAAACTPVDVHLPSCLQASLRKSPRALLLGLSGAGGAP